MEPDASFHFHAGRSLATRLGYPGAAVDRLPDTAVESFAGVGSPFALRDLELGERVVDVGCGAGFDTVLAAGQVGPHGRVIGVDMTAGWQAMLEESGFDQVQIGPAYDTFGDARGEARRPRGGSAGLTPPSTRASPCPTPSGLDLSGDMAFDLRSHA